MTVRTPPSWLQAGSHPAEHDRLVIAGLHGVPLASFAGGVGAIDPGHGVVNITDLKVAANGTPDMSVNVAAGACFIRGTESAFQGVYHLVNDAVVNLTISAADATNPRNDLIVAQVRDSGYSGSDDDARLTVVTGTPAASPADPTVPDNCLVLARVSVAANETAIESGDITDTRTLVGGWETYTPTISGTGWAIGNGTTAGWYSQVGATVDLRGIVTIGSTTTKGASNAVQVSLPPGMTGTSDHRQPGINAYARDSSVGTTYMTWGVVDDGSSIINRFKTVGGGGSDNVTGTDPFTWATGDTLEWSGRIKIAI